MTPQKSTKKPTTSAPGVKVLITATSLAATLGGWALISSSSAAQSTAPAAPATSSLATSIGNQAAASPITIKLAPLPTLVPEIAPQTQLVTVNQARRAAAPQAAAPQPAQTTLVLRDVSAPPQASGGGVSAPGAAAPAPVVNTKSSR